MTARDGGSSNSGVLRPARADARDARASDWRAFVAGVAGGASSTLALHPLDVVKTRLQVQDDPDARRARYAGAWRGARRIVAEEGARGIYAGAAPAIVGSAVSWGAYFAWYDGARARYADALGRERNGALPAGANMMLSLIHI